jgi:hypothetical protein
MAARGRQLLFCAALTGLLVALGPRVASADKYIVVLDIEGERTPRLKKALTRMVKAHHEAMDGSVYRRAARRLRKQKLTPTNVKKVCDYLKADGIIDGTLVKDDGRYRFTIRLRSGRTGAISKKIPMYINTPSLSENMAVQLEERLVAAIDALPRVSGRDDDLEDEEEFVARKKVDKKAERKRLEEKRLAAKEKRLEQKRKAEEDKRRREEEKAEARRKKQDAEDRGKASKRRAAREEEDLDDEEGDDFDDEEGDQAFDDEDPRPKRAAMKDAGDDEEEDDDPDDDDPDATVGKSARPSGPTSPRTTPVLVHAGLSVTGRKLSFRYAGDEANRPLGYKGSPVPGIYAEGELYPLAFGGKRGALANIGIGFMIDRVLRLSSAVADGMGGTAQLATTQARYGGSLLYRWNFGSGPDGISVTPSLGYSKLAFLIDKAAAPDGVVVDVPNVSYTFAEVGAAIRVPIAGPVAGILEAKFLAVLDTGEIQQPTQYGAATVTGVDADGGLEMRFGQHFLARAGARLLLMGYDFKGTGEMADRDANGEIDVGGAADRYLGGYMTAGYIF